MESLSTIDSIHRSIARSTKISSHTRVGFRYVSFCRTFERELGRRTAWRLVPNCLSSKGEDGKQRSVHRFFSHIPTKLAFLERMHPTCFVLHGSVSSFVTTFGSTRLTNGLSSRKGGACGSWMSIQDDPFHEILPKTSWIRFPSNEEPLRTSAPRLESPETRKEAMEARWKKFTKSGCEEVRVWIAFPCRVEFRRNPSRSNSTRTTWTNRPRSKEVEKGSFDATPRSRWPSDSRAMNGFVRFHVHPSRRR